MSLGAGSQVLDLLMLFLWMTLHKSAGKSLQLICIVPIWYVMLV